MKRLSVDQARAIIKAVEEVMNSRYEMGVITIEVRGGNVKRLLPGPAVYIPDHYSDKSKGPG